MQNYQAFHDESVLGVIHLNTAGVAHYVNQAWTEVSGLDSGESLGYGWLEAIHRDDRHRVLTDWRTSTSSRDAIDVSFRIARPDGSRRFVRLRGRPFCVAAGDLDCWVGVVLDLTERVVAERRLQKNNQLLSSILENIPCGVTVFDHDGSLILDNQKFRALLDVPQESPEGVVSDFGTLRIAAGSQDLAYPETGNRWAPGADFNPAPQVREELQPDGRVLELRDAHLPTGAIVTTYTDVTQHKQVIETLQQAKAAAEQAAAAKATFLATMSHEIRTPMNGVIGMTNVLLDSGLTPDQREIVQVIRQSGESLLVVINDILDYSRFESGQMELEWLPLRLQDVIDNSVRLLRERARTKRVRIEVREANDIPPLILGDRNRMQQVLVNLISNAVKFTEQGEVRISVTNASRDTPHASGELTGDMCTLTVCVEDTGIGIPADKLDTIFEPFVQADSSTSRRFGGSGLGLAIARRLAEAMGGTIEIESELGVGTKVRFIFLAEAGVPGLRMGGEGQASLAGRRVLLVSGKRADVRRLLLQLRRWGMECHPSASPSEARALLAHDTRFDLILAASHFVDSHGLDFVRGLRRAGLTVPVVLLSRAGLLEPGPGLFTWIVPRSASESTLYDVLVNAVHAAGELPDAGEDQASEFDESLALRSPLSILVAEDNEINRKVALRMLASFGYKADVVHDGRQVLEALRERTYDLVLMDMQMPHLDGIETTRLIVKTASPSPRPRIVAMSANVMREHVEAALAAGADDYIGKPFSVADLRAALECTAQRGPRAVGRTAASRDLPSPVISQKRVQTYLQGDANAVYLESLVTAFSSTSQDLLVNLRHAVHSGDAASVGDIAHEFCGMCAVLGAEKLMLLTQELQMMASTGSLRGAAALSGRCAVARDETIEALRAVIARQRGCAGRTDPS